MLYYIPVIGADSACYRIFVTQCEGQLLPKQHALTPAHILQVFSWGRSQA